MSAPSLYLKVETLKSFLADNKNKNLYSDEDLWSAHQELQMILKKLLLTDLSYSLEKKVDVDLWNYGFKDYICYLQSQKETAQSHKARNGKSNARVTLAWFLDMASGFYLMLLEELRSTYDLDYSFLSRTELYGYTENKYSNNLVFVKNLDSNNHQNNCNYIAQYCLVHLGDLARYRNQTRKAEMFYRQAILLSPSSGQAYNQIALLEANRGNKLASVFYYVRGLNVKYPFLAASTNLMKILSRFLSNPPSKIINSSTFAHQYLLLEASLRHTYKLKSVVKLRRDLSNSLTSLIATESIELWDLLQILAINIYQIENHEFNEKMEIIEASLTSDEFLIRQISCEFFASFLNSLLLPVYTTKQGGESLLEYFALPCVKVFLEWLCCNPHVLNQKRFMMKRQIWPTLCKVLNELQEIVTVDVKEPDDDFPLPEDYDLQCFIPLEKTASRYDFKKSFVGENVYREKTPYEEQCRDRSLLLLRAQRLLNIGERLASEDFPVKRITRDGNEFKLFDYDIDYSLEDELAAIEEQNINEEDDETNQLEFVEEQSSCNDKSAGILKISKTMDRIIPSPSHYPEENNINSILCHQFENNNNKQVTFRTPSPSLSTISGSQSSQSLSQNESMFPVPPPAALVPPPNFSSLPPTPLLSKDSSPLGLLKNQTTCAIPDSSFFVGHPRQNFGIQRPPSHPYNIGPSYSLFSGPNLLGQNFFPAPNNHHSLSSQREQGVTPYSKSSSDNIFQQQHDHF